MLLVEFLTDPTTTNRAILNVEFATYNVHPKGTSIPILYMPGAPSRVTLAGQAEQRSSPYLFAGGLLLMLMSVGLALGSTVWARNHPVEKLPEPWEGMGVNEP